MKLNRSELIGAMEQVKGAVAQKGFVPILTHVLFSGDTVLGYDSEIGIKAKLTTCKVEGQFNVKFTTMLDLLKQLEDEDIEVTLADDKVKLKCGRHSSTLTQIAEEFPKPNVPVKAGDWHPVAAGLKEAMERALVAVSEDENRRDMSCLYVEGEHVWGADGKQLVRCKVPGLKLPSFLLPRKAVNEVVRLGNPKRIAVKDSVAVFDYATLMFVARLRDKEKYPSEQLSALFKGRKVTGAVPNGLTNALGRLALLSEGDVPLVVMNVGPMGLEMRTKGERTSATEFVATEGVTFPEKGVNAKLLLNLLQFAANWDPGNDPRQLFYLTGETAGFEAFLAPIYA